MGKMKKMAGAGFEPTPGKYVETKKLKLVAEAHISVGYESQFIS